MTLTDTIDEYATDLASDHLITLLQRQGWTDEQINTAADAIGEMFALAMEPAEIVGLRNATGAIAARCGHLAAAAAAPGRIRFPDRADGSSLHHPGGSLFPFVVLRRGLLQAVLRAIEAAAVARSEVHNSMQYISKSAFKKFLAEKQVSSGEFERAMKNHGLSKARQRLSNGWGTGLHDNPIGVYAIKCQLPEEDLKRYGQDS